MDTTLVRYHIRLAVCNCCAYFAKNVMMTSQQFPRIRYVSQVSVISLVELAGSSRSLPTKELIPPPTAISGMWGCRWVVEEASCMGLT